MAVGWGLEDGWVNVRKCKRNHLVSAWVALSEKIRAGMHHRVQVSESKD